VFQASLTGQLVLTSFHAGSAAEAVGRLFDLGVEPYLLRSGLLDVLSQRLVRRLCHCAGHGTSVEDHLGINVLHCRIPRGCEQCGQTGYSGRMLLAESLQPRVPELGSALLRRSDSKELQRIAVAAGMQTILMRASAAIEEGHTSPAEVRRVLGVS
jgi:type II secretory ATPase GspE/PulE/Tfp pilus assembly ATPase PilB-like protein